ncbi:DNA polymerase epsilon subunit 2 [Nymphon striatum]|nr:DNA polymerase epsilon subunit 2 [Nymphon striatum]
MMSLDDLKREVSTVFKMHGLSLHSEANRYLCKLLSEVETQAKLNLWIDKIVENVLKQPLSTTMVNLKNLKTAITESSSRNHESDQSSRILSVMDAFSLPKLTYSEERKKFIRNDLLGFSPPTLYPDAKSKSLLFRERFSILYQLTSRHELFTPAVFGVNSVESFKKFQLYPIEYLLGTTTKMTDLVVLGMLSNIEEGKYHLEDSTGTMIIQLAQAISFFHSGIFTENSFVLAEGWYEDGTFQATAIGFPPIENAAITRSYFGNTNFLGGNEPSFKSSAQLARIEESNEDAMLIILSEVWLDQVKVLEKLRQLFSGYCVMPPQCFIFIGDFISDPHKASNKKVVEECFTRLGNLLTDFPPLLEQSKFVFVPGPNDLGLKGILPRPSIPDCVTKEFRKKVPNCDFTSNPARIQYCTQEIVIIREDLLSKLVRTILSQVHLSPVPLHAQPIYWEFDHALRIYPLPDLIIYADKIDPYSISMSGTQVMNPGSFSKSEFIFKVYLPSSRTIEESQIKDVTDA